MSNHSLNQDWPKWTTQQALDGYVYVVITKTELDNEPVFQAMVDGKTIAVMRCDVGMFLANHRERIFITYEAMEYLS